MAQIKERPEGSGRWLARIRRKGHPEVSDTFSSRKDAMEWADKIERGIERGSQIDHKELRDTTLRDILIRFRDDVSPKRSGHVWERQRLNVYLGEDWSLLTLNQDIANALVRWRDRRLEKVKGQSVNRDLGFLSGIFNHAIKEWRYGFDNPCKTVAYAAEEGGERDVTWTPEALQLFLDHFDFDPDKPVVHARQYCAWVLVIANLTGLRRGSICHTRLEWIDLPRRQIHYPPEVIKNREKYDCPLSQEAIDMLARLVKHRVGHDKLIGTQAPYISSQIREARIEIAKTHPEVANLRLHDQRHTWTTDLLMRRMRKGKPLDKYTLMKITGRKSERELLRYFNPDVEDLARELD